MVPQPPAENMCFGMLLMPMVSLLIALIENMMLKFGLKGMKMRAIDERVGFEADENAPVGVSRVFVVVNRLEDEGDYVLRVFATFEDAVEYARFESNLNELDEYVVIEKEVF